MSRYIDADLIQYEPMLRPQGNGNYEDCEIAYRDEIDNIPTADVRENVRGEWIAHELGGHHHKTILWGHDCSICGHWFVVGEEKIKDYKFCPNCGADMRRES